MTNYGSDQNEVLVLTDEAGNLYAIPRDVVEQHRLTGEQKAQFESQLGEDVSGYSMYQQYMNEQLAGYHQAESRQVAAEARLARSASTGTEGTPEQESEIAPNRLRGLMTGVWRSLPFTKPASSNA